MGSLKKLVSFQVSGLIKPLDAGESAALVAAKAFSPAEDIDLCNVDLEAEHGNDDWSASGVPVVIEVQPILSLEHLRPALTGMSLYTTDY